MKAFSVIFLAFILVVIVLADMGELPLSIRALYRFPYGDKVGHFILFGLLNFFLTLAFLSSQQFSRRSRRRLDRVEDEEITGDCSPICGMAL